MFLNVRQRIQQHKATKEVYQVKVACSLRERRQIICFKTLCFTGRMQQIQAI